MYNIITSNIYNFFTYNLQPKKNLNIPSDDFPILLIKKRTENMTGTKERGGSGARIIHRYIL